MLSAPDLNAITRQIPVYVSPVNLAEIRLGAELLSDPNRRQAAMAMFRRMCRKPILRITGETAEVYAVISARLLKRRKSIDHRVQDLWLASQAIQRGFKLITSNSKDFADIPQLTLVVLKLS